MKRHELKIESKYYDAIISGNKKAEIRYNDRDFKVDDEVVLWQYKDNNYTGSYLEVKITHILTHEEFAGLVKGYVAFSFKVIGAGFVPEKQE